MSYHKYDSRMSQRYLNHNLIVSLTRFFSKSGPRTNRRTKTVKQKTSSHIITVAAVMLVDHQTLEVPYSDPRQDDRTCHQTHLQN